MTTFTRPTLITLTAPTCSGKSFLLDTLVSNDIATRIVSTTTRARRDNEDQGVDYDFISLERSQWLETEGKFFELIEFNGTRYGVTNAEMDTKMASRLPPVVVLEPKGLEIYTRECHDRGWDIFKVYVHTIEQLRIERLYKRTIQQLHAAVDRADGPQNSARADTFRSLAVEQLKGAVGPIIQEHDRRLLSITGDERRWSNTTTWDAIVPGDDVGKAIAMIQQGIKWRNERVKFGFN